MAGMYVNRKLLVTRTIGLLLLLAFPLTAQDEVTFSDLDDQVEQRSPTPQTQEQPSREQRNIGSSPENIDLELKKSEEDVDSFFPAGPMSQLYNPWNFWTDHLRRSVGLDLGMSYTSVYQRADTIKKGPRDASGGDFDFFGRWPLLGCGNRRTGALVFSTEARHRYSKIPPADLNTGTAGGTIDSFGRQAFSVVELYWEQGFFNDRLMFRVGKMKSSLLWDTGRYVSSNYAFFSPAFSDTIPMALPSASLSAVSAIYPTKSTYIYVGIHDANGRTTTTGFDTVFREGEYFSAIEFGWFPNEGKANEGLYHFTLWNIDSRKNADKPNDHGFALTLEQQVGCSGNLVPFLRYAYAHRGLNKIRQNLSIGMVLEEAFGQNDDIIGFAGSWMDPSKHNLQDQYVLEAFYRFQLTPNTHFTPDIQVVINPSDAPNKDSLTVFGLRMRTVF